MKNTNGYHNKRILPIHLYLTVISKCLDRYTVSTEKFLHRLMIQSVRMSDAGEYSVVAGASVSKAYLTVEGKDVRITEPVEKKMTVNMNLIHFYLQKKTLLIIILKMINIMIHF